jgi:hypothetical protein
VGFEGCAAGPCPFCGANGIIPSGVYSFANSVLKLVATNALQLAQLQQLQRIIEDTQSNAEAAAIEAAVADSILCSREFDETEDEESKATASEAALTGIEARIANELPEAKPLLPAVEGVLKANANTVNALAVLVGIVGTVAGVAGATFAYPSWKASRDASPSGHASSVSEVPEGDPPLSSEAAPPRTARRSAKADISPNDPCWCGSGKKKKKCHRL